MHIFINILSHKLAPSSAKRGTSPYSGPSTHGIKRTGRNHFPPKNVYKAAYANITVTGGSLKQRTHSHLKKA